MYVMDTSFRLFGLLMMASVIVMVSFQLALRPFLPSLPDSLVQPTPAKEIKPLSKASPRPSDKETKSPENSEPRLFDWKKQIPPSKLQSYYLPKGFPEPPAVETLRIQSSLHDDVFPSFIQKRHECIAHVRKLHQERFESFLTTHRYKTQQPFVLHIDPAYHNNVGDSLLTLGTLSLLLQQGLSEIQQCHYMQSVKRVPPCEEVIPANNSAVNGTFKLAIWQPGGNWGDLWVPIHQKRIHSFAMLLDNGYSVFAFPQSLVYRNDARGRAEAQIIKGSIGKGLHVSMDTDQGVKMAQNRVLFSWREQKSYELACKLYPFVTNIVMPDVAFQLGPYDLTNDVPSDRMVDVVLFMRNDKESVIQKYRDQSSFINETFRKVPGMNRELSFTIVDWDDRVKLFNPNLPGHHVTKEAIYLVSMGKVIVADRLHATVLAYLSGVPVVYIDQVSGKISKAFDVAFHALDGCWDVEAVKMQKASNFTHALELAAALLQGEGMNNWY